MRAGIPSIILFVMSASLAQAQQPTIAIYGLRHSHTWGHLTRMLKSPHARLAAIAETQPDLIAEAKKLGAGEIPIYPDPAKMLDEVKPAMVWGFMENSRHLEVVEACAPRKIHVIFEKPLAATYAQASRIRQTAARHGIQVMTNYSSAWDPSTHAVKALLQSGVLGRPWRLHTATGHTGVFNKVGRNQYFFGWLLDPVGNGGGAIMDFGCYAVLDTLNLMGRPESVYALAFHLRPAEFPAVDDGATIVLSYPGAVAILEPSWNLPPGAERLEIVSNDGYLRRQDGKIETRKGKEPAAPIAIPPLPPERSDPIAYMAHCLKTGEPVEGMVALDVNVEVNEVLDAAKESIRTGKPVGLKGSAAPKPRR